METYTWYQTLAKPSWAPPAEVFGPVWTALYILIAVSFGVVLYEVLNKKWKSKTFLPFGLNLLFNFAFTPIQFGLRNNLLAALDVLLVLGTLLWAMKVIYPKHKCLAYIQVPYLLWVSFATILQLTITALNL